MRFIRWMQDFKEHWVLLRTPEQFDIMYECCKDLAAQAKAPIVSKEAVAGFKEFKDNYVIPELTMLVDKNQDAFDFERDFPRLIRALAVPQRPDILVIHIHRWHLSN